MHFSEMLRAGRVKRFMKTLSSSMESFRVPQGYVKSSLIMNGSTKKTLENLLQFKQFGPCKDQQKNSCITLSCIMLKNVLRYFKNLGVFTLHVWPVFNIMYKD